MALGGRLRWCQPQERLDAAQGRSARLVLQGATCELVKEAIMLRCDLAQGGGVRAVLGLQMDFFARDPSRLKCLARIARSLPQGGDPGGGGPPPH